MLHAHKELLINTPTGKQWQHLDVLRIKQYEPDYISEFAYKCSAGNFEQLTHITKMDTRFLVPSAIFDIRNISKARKVWDGMMVIPFDATFGCWPWDFADSLSDPNVLRDLEGYDILSARLILMI